MPAPKKIVLLGATGSIGENTLAVLRQHPDKFELVGVAANQNAAALDTIAAEFKVGRKSLFVEDGIDGLMDLATLPEAEVVIVATTGTVGVRPTIAALEAGKTVGLANKETLVLAGQFVMPIARQSSGRLLPVDSEHNAIFQCLEGLAERSNLKRILLTASGGPFLHHTAIEMEHVTRADALRHPNWNMGTKVTIDSASMANKGLEMIEARWLFDLRPDQIEVVIHPQSIIHSMVEFVDGSVIAQMAPPSMTFPIQHVLAYPDKVAPCCPGLDFSRIHRLELRPPDLQKFAALRLAREALVAGGIAPAVYNSANEVAVKAFLDDKIPFSGIPQLIEACLEKASFPNPASLDDLMALEVQLDEFSLTQLNKLTA
ncbi:MAG TPA: 1-deoxy-D-xylulose-5-phosphate reductoisomerase [Oceanipulchritudo sp.]|nr:1-deoxy-D-xylulose-5-phosphate reductoisomerase [Oceanipulchritudo sp.]